MVNLIPGKLYKTLVQKINLYYARTGEDKSLDPYTFYNLDCYVFNNDSSRAPILFVRGESLYQYESVFGPRLTKPHSLPGSLKDQQYKEVASGLFLHYDKLVWVIEDDLNWLIRADDKNIDQ